MTLRFSPPPCTDSPLARLDPRWRLATLTLALLAAAALRTLAAAGIAMVGALALAALARLPLRWYLGRLAAVVLVLALFAVPLPFLLEGDRPVWRWGVVHVSAHGAYVALLLGVKGITLVTLALVVLAAAPLDATLKAAHALRIPGVIVQLGLLTYRYVFLLADELRRLRVALRVRGYRNRPNRHSYRTLGHVAGTLIVRGHERAERVAQAMRCRGFDGRFRSLVSFTTTAADVALFVVVAGGAGALWAWDWRLWGRG